MANNQETKTVTKKKVQKGQYLSAKEQRVIAKHNREVMNRFERLRSRENIPEAEYLSAMKNPDNVLEIENLHTYFFTDTGTVKAVDGVSFDVPIGKTVGVVGESGCGKSVTSLSVMQLIPRPTGQIVEGEIRLRVSGEKVYDVVKMPTDTMLMIRGNTVSMIFQEPMTSLNPVFRVGEQVDEVVELHNPQMTKKQIKGRTIDMFNLVKIANSEGVYNMYPHELSGGMRQRAMIAMAPPAIRFLSSPMNRRQHWMLHSGSDGYFAQSKTRLTAPSCRSRMTWVWLRDGGLCRVAYAGRIVERASQGDLYTPGPPLYDH